jgi:DNA-binding NtrC family response regulator
LRRQGYRVEIAADGVAAIAAIEGERPDLVLCDLSMPRLSGLEFLDWIRDHAPDLEVVIVTANADLDSAVQCMRRGAHDYLVKPFSGEQLLHRVGRALERRTLLRNDRSLRQRLDARIELDRIVGTTPPIESLRRRIELVAHSDVNVLITGETGTGKELVARALHATSRRHDRPLVAVNCAAIPEALIGSELFGHERGAFTTAMQTRIGRFEAAEGGTLFLDEIGDLPLATQGALLRVLQERCFERVGSNRSRDADVRIIAATKEDLARAVQRGCFREDLYYRLHVAQLVCPPLREHRDDIPLLAVHFLVRLQNDAGRPALRLSKPALERLMLHDWPGNVRELENLLARAALLSSGGEITAANLEFATVEPGAAAVAGSPTCLQDMERAHILKVLETHRWNRSRAARALGIDRGTLARKITQFGLSADSS